MSVLENFNESMNAITTLSSFILCPQSHKQPITYTLISLIMSVLENFNESMNAITTLSSFIRYHLITTTLHELNASFLSKLLKS